MAMVSLLSQLPPRRRGIRAAVAYLNQVPAVFRVLSRPRGSLQRSIGGTMMAMAMAMADSGMSSCVPAYPEPVNLCCSEHGGRG